MFNSDRKIFFWLFLVVAIVYVQALKGFFYLDDAHSVVSNTALHSYINLLKLWTSAKYYSSSPDNFGYRSVTTFFNSVCWLLGSGSTWPYSIAKKLFHVGVCFLLFKIWSEIWGQFKTQRVTSNREIALFMTFVFAIESANTQVVNYIAASSTLLAGFFYLLAFSFYLKYKKDFKIKWIFFGTLSYLLSVLSKEEGITLIAVILAYELLLYIHFKKFEKRVLLAWALYLVAAGVGVFLIVHMFEASSDLARGSISRYNYFITQLRAYVRYMILIFWPGDLNADNLEFGFSMVWDWHVTVALVINLLIVFAALFSIKKNPVFTLGIAWFYIGISPASSVVPLAEPVNDHRMYIAYFGFIPAVVDVLSMLVDRIIGWTKGFQFRKKQFAALALVILSIMTLNRNRVWASANDLLYDTMVKNPSSGRAINNYALTLMAEGRWAESLVLIDRCLGVFPTYSICWVNRAQVLVSLGRENEADEAYHKAIEYDFIGVMANNYYGDFLKRRGKYQQSLPYLRKAFEASYARDLSLGLSLVKMELMFNNFDSAKIVLQKVGSEFPESIEVQNFKRQLGM